MTQWGEFIQRHGFGVFVALFLLLIIFGLLPSPLLEGLKAHMSRDSVREGLFVQICLNTAKNAAQADGCLAALIPDK